MNKHTEGPWKLGCAVVGKGDGSITSQFVTVADGSVVASAYGNCLVKNDEQVRANARLIAAAPDMLKALQNILADMESVAPQYRANASIREVRAAIERAA